MALAYPVGECFFQRSGLDTSQPEGFHASDPNQFHTRMLVEYVWNKEAHHGSKECNSPGGYWHFRSGYKIVRGAWWNTDYGNWTHLPFSYGPTEKDIKRTNNHNLCVNGNRFRDREKGGSYEAMPMPTSEERWVWIDINFTRMKEVTVWQGGDKQMVLESDDTLGLKRRSQYTLGLDCFGLIELLTLPRQLRKRGPFKSRLLKVVGNGNIKNVKPVEHSYSDSYDFSWLTISKANFGVDLQWCPTVKSDWLENWMKNVLTIAVGFVPGIGPILAIAFPLAWTLLRDPDSFVKEMRNLAPGIDLTIKMIEDLQKQAAETRKFLPDQWLKLDLPSQGLKKEGSLVSINLGGGDKDPDAERAASDEVFPNAQQPLSLDELGKDESFIITDEVLKLSDGNATWKPAESNFETVSDNQETDNPENPPDDEKVETIEF